MNAFSHEPLVILYVFTYLPGLLGLGFGDSLMILVKMLAIFIYSRPCVGGSIRFQLLAKTHL